MPIESRCENRLKEGAFVMLHLCSNPIYEEGLRTVDIIVVTSNLEGRENTTESCHICRNLGLEYINLHHTG